MSRDSVTPSPIKPGRSKDGKVERVVTEQSFSGDRYTGQGYAFSLLLHGSILALAWIGVPFFHREIPPTPPLIVDLVPIEDITSAAPPPTPEPTPEPQPVAPEPPKPAPAADTPPPDTMPPPPPDPIPKPEPAKVVPPKPKPPPPKPVPPKSKQDDIAALQKLLKDMQKNQPQPKQQTADSKAPPTNNIAPTLSDRASMTELDAIRRHIEGCWRIDPGKEGNENLSAEVKVFINPDGSARAEIVDMTRYFVDSAFRTFANSARNAVLACGNIPISPEHYNELKEIIMNFSPQGRIN